MSWFRIDDTFWSHRKARKAGPEALGLWVACGAYASSSACDDTGLITIDNLEFVAVSIGARNWKKLAAKLVEVGLWDNHANGYAFHDWDDYRQGGDAELDRRKERDAERKRLARQRRDNAKLSADASADIPRTHPGTLSAEMSAPPVLPVLPVPSRPPGLDADTCPRTDDPIGMVASVWTQALKSATGRPQTRLSPLDVRSLHAVCEAHAGGKRGQDLLDWVSVTATEFARYAASSPQFGGLSVKRLATWLDAGKPKDRPPRGALLQGADNDFSAYDTPETA